MAAPLAYSPAASAPRRLYDSTLCRLICANAHPDHRTIANVRNRFLGEREVLFTEMLLVAQAMGLVKLGTVRIDGIKIKANASMRKALTWGRPSAPKTRSRARSPN